MNEKKTSIQENNEENIDVDNYDIDELIERPRISSIPKVNLNIRKEEDNNDDEAENFDYFDNNQPLYDLNLMEYGKNLQKYLKEKTRILHDEDYRRNIITKNNILTSDKTEQEKITMMKKLNEKMNCRGPEIDPSIEVKYVI